MSDRAGAAVRSPGAPGGKGAVKRPATGGPVPTATVTVYEPRNGALAGRPDRLAVEEPLEIRLAGPDGASTLSITMRTPGHDFELVAGFLLAEGVVQRKEDVRRIAYCLDPELDAEQRYNVVTAELNVAASPASLQRHVITSSACGVCGTTSVEAVRLCGHPELPAGTRSPSRCCAPSPSCCGPANGPSTRPAASTASRSSPPTGRCSALREDVGRHNAVDKVIGWALLDGRLPLGDVVLMVSGRISFEIVQKALRGGVPVVAAVSAATSLAARLATETGMTLVGFLRGDSCTVYAGRERIDCARASARH